MTQASYDHAYIFLIAIVIARIVFMANDNDSSSMSTDICINPSIVIVAIVIVMMLFNCVSFLDTFSLLVLGPYQILIFQLFVSVSTEIVSEIAIPSQATIVGITIINIVFCCCHWCLGYVDVISSSILDNFNATLYHSYQYSCNPSCCYYPVMARVSLRQGKTDEAEQRLTSCCR